MSDTTPIATDEELNAIKAQLRARWPEAVGGELPDVLKFNDGRTWEPYTFAESGHTSLLIALWLDAETSKQLAIPDGESADNLHITLCYCGDAAQYDDLKLARVMTLIDDLVRWREPLSGAVAGHGRFYATESSDGSDVFYAVPSIPGLAELRDDIASSLGGWGIDVSDTHGWTPHITLAYLKSKAKQPVPTVSALPLRFSAVTVCIGDKQTTIPFSGDMGMYSELATTKDNLTRVYQAVEFAEPPEWAPFLPKSGTYVHPTRGVLDFGTDSYNQIISNFKDKVYQERIPVNAEHGLQASGAVGWITDLRLNEDTSVDAKVEWNDRGRALIGDDRFRYVSAEIFPTWNDPVTEKPINNVAVGLAITTRPYFKESVLRPLAASDAVWTLGAPAQKGLHMSEESKTASGANPTAVQLTEAEVIEFRELKAKADAQAVELAEFKAKADSQAVELSEIRKANRTKAFTDEVRGKSDANNRVWFGDSKGHVDHLVSLSETFGDESPQVQHYIATNRAAAEAIGKSAMFSAIGSGVGAEGGSAADRMEAKAVELSEKEGITKAQAFDRLMQTDRELARQIVEERVN